MASRYRHFPSNTATKGAEHSLRDAGSGVVWARFWCFAPTCLADWHEATISAKHGEFTVSHSFFGSGRWQGASWRIISASCKGGICHSSRSFLCAGPWRSMCQSPDNCLKKLWKVFFIIPPSRIAELLRPLIQVTFAGLKQLVQSW